MNTQTKINYGKITSQNILFYIRNECDLLALHIIYNEIRIDEDIRSLKDINILIFDEEFNTTIINEEYLKKMNVIRMNIQNIFNVIDMELNQCITNDYIEMRDFKELHIDSIKNNIKNDIINKVARIKKASIITGVPETLSYLHKIDYQYTINLFEKINITDLITDFFNAGFPMPKPKKGEYSYEDIEKAINNGLSDRELSENPILQEIIIKHGAIYDK